MCIPSYQYPALPLTCGIHVDSFWMHVLHQSGMNRHCFSGIFHMGGSSEDPVRSRCHLCDNVSVQVFPPTSIARPPIYGCPILIHIYIGTVICAVYIWRLCFLHCSATTWRLKWCHSAQFITHMLKVIMCTSLLEAILVIDAGKERRRS